MREVNFSIPNVNKASVGITTALYDRRALDCTSTLPLINSLNHLAYLTTSSARIRDILTIDGGVERLVCVLKSGRSKDMMEMWKWNLAFQCVVNIGVRGSEGVRTRVVEADMVPVIATILDNYIKVVEKFKEKSEKREKRDAEAKKAASAPRGQAQLASGGTKVESTPTSSSTFTVRSGNISEPRSNRRQAPPSIEIPSAFAEDVPPPTDSAMETTPIAPVFASTSPPERTTFGNVAQPPSHRSSAHHHHHHHRSTDNRFQQFEAAFQGVANARQHTIQPLATAGLPMETPDGFGIRAVRDIDRLPSMVPGLPSGVTSQPESPTTPTPLVAASRAQSVGRSRRRPSIRHQRSMSGTSDDANGDEGPDETTAAEAVREPVVDIQNDSGVDMTGLDGSEAMLDAVETTLTLTDSDASQGQEGERFNITHRSANGSILQTGTPPNGIPFPTAAQPANDTIPAGGPSGWPRQGLDRPSAAGLIVAMPRDEDVLMSLQLLAYVSKYCNLRTYFQNSHLVPRLAVDRELYKLEDDHHLCPTPEEDEPEEEYLVPDDYNIFPLVEKFTMRHHPSDMKYWAGVVMRNLCRKDDTRGGIRQCAYYECGKWEEFTRQFAKCRRCRRTKYCSKECQKAAWVYHRHWCVAAGETRQ